MRENNNEFDFGKLLSIFKTNWIAIVIVTLVMGIVGFGYTKFFVSPTYSAKLLLCVSNTTEGSEEGSPDNKYYNQQDIVASNKLVNACKDIITSNSVLQAVAATSGVRSSIGALR